LSRSEQEILASYGSVRIRRAADDEIPVYEIDQPVDSISALELLLSDDELEEIVFNGPTQGLRVYHRRFGVCKIDIQLRGEDVSEIIEWLSKKIGYDSREFPILEGMLPDGSRVSITLEPIAVDGPYFSIRKFPKRPFSLSDLVMSGMMTPEVAAALWLYVEGLGVRPANILIAGGAGTGKTTLLSCLAQLIPQKSRIIIIEDTPEINISHPNVVRLTVTPLHFEKQVDLDMLLRASLRMRPDRLIVGEVRGREAETLLAAMNTGHLGSMGTIHANTSQEAVRRLINPPMNVPPQMLGALDLIVTTAKMIKGNTMKRVVLDVSEVAGFDERGPRLNQLYKYVVHEERTVPTGVPSSLRERFIKETGITRKMYGQLLAEKAAQLSGAEEYNNE